MSVRFQIQKAKNGKFYFHLLSQNGEVILTSQMYASRANAKKGIEAVRTNATHPDQYEIRTNKARSHYFVLKAGNQQVIGSSEAYATTTGVHTGIKSVSKNAPRAIIEDIIEDITVKITP